MKTDPQWNRIGLYPHHGIALPLFALHSQQGGSGTFFDLLPLIDWCQSIGFDVIQLLPLNDSGDDPSPYNPLSATALDPIYLSLGQLPDALEFNPQPFTSLSHRERKAEKLTWLSRYFQKTYATLSVSNEYRAFVAANPWLDAYCLFKALKTHYRGEHWKNWPITFPVNDPSPWKEAMQFHAFVQYHCFSQLETVHRYADSKQIFLQGDIPILVSPDSADVWAHTSLFHIDQIAGAPPDRFNPLGQKWGFPIYNWDTLRNEQFAWWRERLKTASRLYDLYRLDHTVGFFRIWAIPEGKEAIDGSFIPEDPSLWMNQGREVLNMMIDASPMLPIAEDLGTIPPGVYPILKELGICGTKLIRWQRKWEGDRGFIPLDQYEPFSVTTVSTADSETLELWWSRYPEEAMAYADGKGWPCTKELSQTHRFALLRDAHRTSSYFHINLLQEYLGLFPELKWPDPEKERINIPGTLLQTNWTYRFRPSIEEITTHEALKDALRALISQKLY